MQAIILAAGMGRRLGKYTRDNTKCMLPVNGVRLIDRMLEQLCQLNLSRLVLVVGYKGKELKDYIGDRYEDRLHIEYAENPVYDKTNNIYSLALVKDKMVEDDTLLIESDLILDDSLFQMILEDPYPNLALVAKYETWMDGTMVRIDKDNNIVNFVPKKAFKYSEVDSYYKTVNIYKFSKEFSNKVYVPFLDAYCKVMGNNEYYEQVLRVITLLDQANLKALPIGDKPWYEIDDVQDKDIAEAIFSPEKDRLHKYHVRYGGYWRFPQMLDFCYLVNPFFPPKRMRDEMRANFDQLLTQYPSGMAVNSLLAGKYFGVSSQYIIVGNGAAELIKSLMEQFIQEDSKVGVVYPTFEEYPHRLKQESIVPFYPELPDLHYSAADLKAFYASRDITALLLINPDNPSGNFIPKEDVLSLAAWCGERGVRLIVDESFVDFSDEGPANSLLNDDILEQYPGLLVMKSISKSYGVPGLRLGILAGADTALLDKMKKDVAIWNINSFAEFYMQIFNKYEFFYKSACASFVSERNRFAEQLSSIPYLRVIPSQANYFLCQVTEHYTSRQLTEKLLNDYNILIKDCDNKTGLEGKNFIRLAIRDKEDNDSLVNALNSLRGLNICICGGGNLGHVMAGYLSAQGIHRVNVLTGHPEKWSTSLTINVNNSSGNETLKGELNMVTSSAEQVIPDADLVFICLPGPHIKPMLEKIRPHLKKNTIVGSIVSNTGFFFHAHEVISSQPIFGFQRVPFISRIVEYGKEADLLGSKRSLSVCVENGNGNAIRMMIENLLHTPVKLLGNFYEVSLSNSNPLLHPARLYTMWKNWNPAVKYDRIPMFYAEWDDTASQLLIDMDIELQSLLRLLPVEPNSVPYILEYYESVDASTLTQKIRSIPAFKSIKSPMIENEGDGYIPDLNSRYFIEDFECGTFYIRDTARLKGVDTPAINRVCEWYESLKAYK